MSILRLILIIVFLALIIFISIPIQFFCNVIGFKVKKLYPLLFYRMIKIITGININFDSTKLNKNLASEKENLLKLRKFIEKNFEYVGKDFSKKVREIYYDKKSKKTIYGTTTKKEREDLIEEGIDLISVPWIEKDN